MKRYIENLWLVTAVPLAIVTLSLAISVATSKWHWFGRSGAIATLAGVVLTVRPLVRLGLAGFIEHTLTLDDGTVQPTPEEIEAQRQRVLDGRALKHGTWLVITGTLIWAYGELLGGLPS